MKLLKLIILIVLPLLTIGLCITSDKGGRVFFTALILFLICERTWEALYTSKEKNKEKIEGDWTLPVSMISYIFLVILCLIEFYICKREANLIVMSIALATYITSIFLRLWAVATLGDQWSIHITGIDKLNAKRRLVLSGPYRFIRHPVYLGIILEQCAIPLVANLYITFIIMLVTSVIIQSLKARLEEEAMRKRLGEEYIRYAASIPRFNIFFGFLKGLK